MLLTLLNDKYFKNYNKLLNYDYNKYLIICKELLFVFIYKGTKLCDFEYIYKHIDISIYKSLIQIAKLDSNGNPSYNFDTFILTKYYTNDIFNNNFLIITPIAGPLYRLTINNKNFDTFLLYNS